MRPRLGQVTGIHPCQTSIFETIKESGGRIANYLTKDHWNPIHRRSSFMRNLRHYDQIQYKSVSLQAFRETMDSFQQQVAFRLQPSSASSTLYNS